MIVDDEALIRWSVRTHLEEMGFAVIEAESGRQALDRLNDDVSLALVDLRLPDTDGLTLIGRLKSRYPGCRVILMTASASPEVNREAREVGAVRVVDKPFDLQALTATIRTTLAARPGSGRYVALRQESGD
jgi:DNA-binding NtrC family response regulator